MEVRLSKGSNAQDEDESVQEGKRQTNVHTG